MILSKTAAEMQISNVSVHKALHSLENSLRCPLFKNEGRNLIPLKSAYVLQENSQKIVQDIVTAVNKTREAAGFAAKVLHLGSLYSLTVNTIPNVISGLKLRRGELDIQLLLSSNLDLVKKLKTTELDAIIVALNEREKLGTTVFFQGVAIPHAVIQSSTPTFAVLSILDKPITFPLEI